jgi:DNA-binding response OmpR family regulator
MQSLIRPRILYADENEDACFMLGTLLGFSDIETTSTNTIDQALKLAQAERFDLYLLDTRFSEGNGLDLCRMLRKFNSQTPIVFYSGDAREIDKANGLAAGADAYLVKPNTDTVTATIFQLLKHTSKSVYQTI